MKNEFEPPRNLRNVVLEQIEALGFEGVVLIKDSNTLTVTRRDHPDGGYWTIDRFLYDLVNAAYRAGQKEVSE